jgi:hypothetical protein
MLEQVDKGFAVILAHTRNIKGNAIDLEFGLGLIIVKFRLIQRYEFKDHHGNSEDIGLVDIILDIILQLVDIVKLLRRKDVVFNLRTLGCHLEVAAMPILLLYLQQVKLHVALWA